MILATAKVQDFDRFVQTFSTKGAEKRKQHGSKGSTIFRDPNEEDRVWVLFDWDEEGWQNFVSDPEVPAIFQEGGVKVGPRRLRSAANTTPSPRTGIGPLEAAGLSECVTTTSEMYGPARLGGGGSCAGARGD